MYPLKPLLAATLGLPMEDFGEAVCLPNPNSAVPATLRPTFQGTNFSAAGDYTLIDWILA